MKRALLTGTCIALFFCPAITARADVMAPFDIIKPDDLSMSCGGISGEIALMEDVILGIRPIERDANYTSAGIGVAKAVGGFLIGSVPGAIGVMAAGQIANEANELHAEDALDLKDAAKQRRGAMVGLYSAKGCQGPIYSVIATEAAKAAADAAAIEPTAGQDAAFDDRDVSYNN